MSVNYHAIFNISVKVFYVFIATITNYFITKYYGLSAMGTYALVVSLLTIASLFCTFGIDYSVIKTGIQARENIYNGALFISSLFFILMPVIMLILHLFDLNYLYILVVFFFGVNLYRHGVFVSQKKSLRSYLIDNIFRPLVVLGVLAFNIYFAITDFKTIFLVSLLLSSFISIYFLINNYVKFQSFKLESFTFAFFKERMLFSLPYFLVSILTILMYQSDRFLVEHFLGVEVLGAYAISLYLVTVMDFISQSFVAVILPSLAGSSADKMKSTGLKASRTSVSIVSLSILYLILMYFLMPTILPFLDVKESYISIITDSFLILSLFYLSSYILGLSASVISFTEYKRYLVYFLCISLILGIILNVILTPQLGVLGASLSTGVAILCYKVLTFFFALKKLKINTSIIRLYR